MIVTIKDKRGFMNNVFGADSFLEHWPELETSGVTVRQEHGLYYILDEGDNVVNNTAFFAPDEMQYLEINP